MHVLIPIVKVEIGIYQAIRLLSIAHCVRCKRWKLFTLNALGRLDGTFNIRERVNIV